MADSLITSTTRSRGDDMSAFIIDEIVLGFLVAEHPVQMLTELPLCKRLTESNSELPKYKQY